MKLTGHALAFAGLALAAGIYVTQPASAETLSYKVQLLPSSEVPPNDTKGSGSLTATYDTTSKVLTWTATFSGLSGPAVAAHFHGPADKGVNAAVIVPQTGGLESPMKGHKLGNRVADLVCISSGGATQERRDNGVEDAVGVGQHLV